MADKDKNQQQLPQESQIKKSAFNRFMTRLFGYQRKGNSLDKIEFTKVDVGSDEKVGQALLNQLQNQTGPMSETLEKLFNSWLTDNTDKLSEIANRKERVDQLAYATLNDPYIGRTVQLYADEACQLDEQDTIINIETPDSRMTRDMYKLLSQWGITQTRIRSTIENLATYGDAFWANKVSENGVERIIPLQQLQVTDRIEFNPVQALEKKKRREGGFYSFASNNYLISKMLQSMEDTGDFADLFETKTFGFSIDGDLIVPPWSITHFRVGSDLGQFWPFGTSPILGTLAPFKQISSTIALQSLARIMSFPVTIYKVKTSDAMDEGRQFAVVNRVREAYDNIGVSPTVGNSEVYTVNTKMWVPEGLLDVDVKESKVDIGYTDDIKIYQDRVAVAAGIPKSFFSDEFYGFGTSGQSLLQQYKPFARKVYSIQSAFLESLADLFRIHFAITGQYDFRMPFTLSMKFPAVEVSDERNTARKNSIEIAASVVELIKSAIGADEDTPLPPDIVRDIIGKYTFLDPGDIMKWTRDAFYTAAGNGNAAQFEGPGIESSGGSDFGEPSGPEDSGPEDSGIDEPTDLGDEGNAEVESITDAIDDLPESTQRKSKDQLLREKELCKRYKEKREDLYFQIMEEHAVNSFVRDNQHVVVFNNVPSYSDLMLETLSNESSASGNSDRLREAFAQKPTKKKKNSKTSSK